VKWFRALRQLVDAFHFLETFCNPRYSSFSAASSLGKETAMSAGADDHICKAFSVEELLSLIRPAT
jgi:CheY-like chemotaxis protein